MLREETGRFQSGQLSTLQRVLRIRNASRVQKEYGTLLRIRLRLSSITYRMCHHKWYDSLHSQRPPNWQPLFSPYTPTYPTRPTVSSNGTFTEKVSRHVDYSHKPLYTGIPLYIWHTDLLNKLQKLPPLPTGSPLDTLDVPSLLHRERILRVAVHFNTSGHSVDDMTVRVIQKLWKDDPVSWIDTLNIANLGGMNPRSDSL